MYTKTQDGWRGGDPCRRASSGRWAAFLWDFLWEGKREPQVGELRTYRWEELFELLADHGLIPDKVVYDCSDEGDSVLSQLQYFDDGDLGARITRNLLRRGGNPNAVVDGLPLFMHVDDNFTCDMYMDLYDDKRLQDVAFRFWLVLMGFGGVQRDGRYPVTMHGGHTPAIFRDFEKYDYCIDRTKKNHALYIFEKETHCIVATV